MKNSQNLEIKIREAKLEDHPMIKEIYEKAFKNYDQRSIDLQISSYFKDPKSYDVWDQEDVFKKGVMLSQKYLVTEDIEGKILGYGGIERPNTDGDAPRAFWLNWTAIDPKYQGRGIGKKLLIKLIEEAKKKGATTVSVKTDSVSESVHKTYEKLGFKRIGRIKGYYNEMDLIIYSLELKK